MLLEKCTEDENGIPIYKFSYLMVYHLVDLPRLYLSKRLFQ